MKKILLAMTLLSTAVTGVRAMEEDNQFSPLGIKKWAHVKKLPTEKSTNDNSKTESLEKKSQDSDDPNYEVWLQEPVEYLEFEVADNPHFTGDQITKLQQAFSKTLEGLMDTDPWAHKMKNKNYDEYINNIYGESPKSRDLLAKKNSLFAYWRHSLINTIANRVYKGLLNFEKPTNFDFQQLNNLKGVVHLQKLNDLKTLKNAKVAPKDMQMAENLRSHLAFETVQKDIANYTQTMIDNLQDLSEQDRITLKGVLSKMALAEIEESGLEGLTVPEIGLHPRLTESDKEILFFKLGL